MQLSEHPFQAYLGPQHPASLLQVPLWSSGPNSYHCLDENSIDLLRLFLTFTQVDGYIQRMPESHTLVLSLSVVSAVCIQIV